MTWQMEIQCGCETAVADTPHHFDPFPRSQKTNPGESTASTTPSRWFAELWTKLDPYFPSPTGSSSSHEPTPLPPPPPPANTSSRNQCSSNNWPTRTRLHPTSYFTLSFLTIHDSRRAA
uniref:Uncharacterized protein n=1 Tax=Mesocestoides corti TaxID=53468 RepID=A0A5K3FJ29_MESCO